MILFLKNISDSVTHDDLVAFVTPALEGGMFKKAGSIEKISVQSIQIKATKVTEYHALVTVTPDTAALKAIRRLNGQPLNGKRVAVRQYFVRSYYAQRDFHGEERRREAEVNEAPAPKYSKQALKALSSG